MNSSLVSDSGFPGLTESPVCFPSLYSVEHYIDQKGAGDGVWHFILLPYYPGRLPIVHNRHPQLLHLVPVVSHQDIVASGTHRIFVQPVGR